MTLDTTNIGLLAAKALAKIDRDYGDEPEMRLGDAVLVVELIRPSTEEREDEETTADFPPLETTLLKVSTSGRWVVERGLLAMAVSSLDAGAE